MSAALPEIVDAWRMVHAQRTFQGNLPLAVMPRLVSSLAESEGTVTFDLEFSQDVLGIAVLWVRADAPLRLTCQRTLETFVLPVRIDTRLGLIKHESDEAGLPEGYEPLLLGDGSLRLSEVIEDELILALPVVPMKPGTEQALNAWNEPPEADEEEARPHPFAALGKLKNQSPD